VKKPREIAVQVLQARLAGNDYTENLLETALAGAQLSPPDRGLCQELVYGIVRQQAALDWLIGRKTNGRPQKTVLQLLLQLGLYQIFWLDRIPDHAAVNETVEMAKHAGFNTQAGFINAVLRGYLREVDDTKKLLAELKLKQQWLGYSHPEWLVSRWQQRWGNERTAQLLNWNNTPPKTYGRVNTLKYAGTKDTPAELLCDKWRHEGVEAEFLTRDWTGENLAFELKEHPPLATLESFSQGRFYIQDPSTLLAVRELDPQPGETVLDLCAAPGGKTTFIAQLMKNHGRLLASDFSADRMKLVAQNCERLGVTCVETVSPAAFDDLAAQCDKVLLDAPCSNTGVMRRRVDLRWRVSAEEIRRLRIAQLDLLNQAAPLVKPGGVLVYSTCSLEPEENSGVVKEFLATNANFKLERERELIPFVDGVDGAFVARLVKL
jgi:16S rRNA (cytosine967-C5)-methyltransferase